MLNPTFHFDTQQVVNKILQKMFIKSGNTKSLSIEIQTPALISSFHLPAEIYPKCIYVP